MSPCLGISVLILAVASTSYAQEPKLPLDARITRDKDGNIWRVNLSGGSTAHKAKIRPETLKQIAGISTLTELNLSFSDVSDEALEPLKRLHSLKGLNLAFSNVTGKSIRTLSTLHNLVSLRLTACDVGNDDLKALSDMPQLANLYLGRTQVTDAGMPQIGELSELVLLDLSSCAITDQGLRSLGHFKQLQHLWLSVRIRYKKDGKSQLTDTSVEYLSTLKTLVDLQIGDSQLTKQGLSRLRAALPKCRINTNSLASTILSRKDK